MHASELLWTADARAGERETGRGATARTTGARQREEHTHYLNARHSAAVRSRSRGATPTANHRLSPEATRFFSSFLSFPFSFSFQRPPRLLCSSESRSLSLSLSKYRVFRVLSNHRQVDNLCELSCGLGDEGTPLLLVFPRWLGLAGTRIVVNSRSRLGYSRNSCGASLTYGQSGG